MFEIALFLYLCQARDPGSPYAAENRRPPEMVQEWLDAWPAEKTGSISGDVLKREAYENAEFAKRFNALTAALDDFASSYNSGRTMNVKKVKAVEKALRELEKSSWFRRRKGD
jgi:hypothetical protein